jgi:hypothetical protein
MDNVVRWHDDTRLMRWSPEAKAERMRSGQTIKELEHMVFLAIDNAPSEYVAPLQDPA